VFSWICVGGDGRGGGEGYCCNHLSHSEVQGKSQLQNRFVVDTTADINVELM